MVNKNSQHARFLVYAGGSWALPSSSKPAMLCQLFALGSADLFTCCPDDLLRVQPPFLYEIILIMDDGGLRVHMAKYMIDICAVNSSCGVNSAGLDCSNPAHSKGRTGR